MGIDIAEKKSTLDWNVKYIPELFNPFNWWHMCGFAELCTALVYTFFVWNCNLSRLVLYVRLLMMSPWCCKDDGVNDWKTREVKAINIDYWYIRIHTHARIHTCMRVCVCVSGIFIENFSNASSSSLQWQFNACYI